jgi:hypothetical protein
MTSSSSSAAAAAAAASYKAPEMDPKLRCLNYALSTQNPGAISWGGHKKLGIKKLCVLRTCIYHLMVC